MNEVFPSIFDSVWFTVGAAMLGALVGVLVWLRLARPKLKRFEGFLLGRHPDPVDERDYVRAIRITADKQPAIVDLTPQEPPIENQGSEGSCVGHATAGAVEMQVRKRGIKLMFHVSRRFIYWIARPFSGDVRRDTGTNARAALKAMAQNGFTFENLCPYKPGTYNKKPSDEAFADAKKHRIGAYHRVANTAEAVCSVLAEGDTVLLGFPVHSNFKPDSRGVIPQPMGEVEGGHEMLIVGYDKHRRMFHVRNSWGTGWGDKGRCWMHFDHVVDQRNDLWTLEAVA